MTLRSVYKFKLTVFCLLAGFLAACTATPLPLPSQTATATQDGTLVPYQTVTLTATSSLTPTSRFSATPLPTITTTPVTYKVRGEDDMYGIAFRYGISPQALMTANPKVNPRAMSVGTILIIPVTPHPPDKQETPTPIPPTPLPAITLLRDPDCYPDAAGGAWCFLLIKNTSAQGYESVIGTILLTTSQVTAALKGTDAAPLKGTAISPLDLLPAGASLPLSVYFPAPVPAILGVTGQIVQKLPQPYDDKRYLAPVILNRQVAIRNDGKSASISGQVSLPEKSQAAQLTRLAVIAYAADGAVAGLRQWESGEVLAPGSTAPFDLEVYSLGPPIDHVDVLVEARP